MLTALLLAFALDPAPVTNGEYRRCVEAGRCRPAAFEDPRSAANLTTGKEETAAAYRKVAASGQPAVGISWSDARAYCAFAGKRLPTARELPVRLADAAVAVWLADARGSRRAVRGRGARGFEERTARAPWLGLRCAK